VNGINIDFVNIKNILLNNVELSHSKHEIPQKTQHAPILFILVLSGFLRRTALQGFFSETGPVSEECRLLGCVAVCLLEEPTFQRNVSSPSAG
jgi:hypothetical protein